MVFDYKSGKNSIIILALILFLFFIILGFNGFVKHKGNSNIPNKTEISTSSSLPEQQTNQSSTNTTIEQYECNIDLDCNESAVCINRSCIALSCDYCQYLTNHSCNSYECCKDEDCSSRWKCEGNKCVYNNINQNVTLPFETLEKYSTGYEDSFKILNYSLPGRYDLSEISLPSNIAIVFIMNSSEWNYTKSNIVRFSEPNTLEFSDFDNYFLILAIWRYDSGPNTISISKIQQTGQSVEDYYSLRDKSQRQNYENHAWHVIKLKKIDFAPRNDLSFTFIRDLSTGTEENTILKTIKNVDI